MATTKQTLIKMIDGEGVEHLLPATEFKFVFRVEETHGTSPTDIVLSKCLHCGKFHAPHCEPKRIGAPKE